MNKDICVYCEEELNCFERSRSVCWSCREAVSETYSEDFSKDIQE